MEAKKKAIQEKITAFQNEVQQVASQANNMRVALAQLDERRVVLIGMIQGAQVCLEVFKEENKEGGHDSPGPDPAG